MRVESIVEIIDFWTATNIACLPTTSPKTSMTHLTLNELGHEIVPDHTEAIKKERATA